MKTFLILTLSLIIIGCSNEPQNKESLGSASNEEKFLPDSNYVVIQYDNQKHQYKFETGNSTSLNVEELKQIAQILDSAIDEHNKKVESHFQISTLDYKRQYLPILNENNEKVIWINFNCGTWAEVFEKDEIYEVMDGGNCHFNITINLTTKTYYNLFVNGYA
jgi:hypothetical protein